MSRSGWIYKRLYDAWNNRLRTAAGGRWARYCRPTWISFLLTERCNARCVHCDIWRNRGRETDSPTLDQWKVALAELRDWLGPVHVCLTGGEALLRPFTIDLVRYGSELGLFVEVLTHGFWEDQGKIEQLALARPWRVTLSLDGFGATHDRIRGRAGFFDKTARTIETLSGMRRECGLPFAIQLKTVIMSHNLNDACELARYATERGLEIFYQPIEQNYNTPEDPQWFRHSENWPTDPEAATAVVERLIEMKRQGFAIANSTAQLAVMIPYFREPDAWRVITQSHGAHERRASCSSPCCKCKPTATFGSVRSANRWGTSRNAACGRSGRHAQGGGSRAAVSNAVSRPRSERPSDCP
jgi:molybdenum cofactor biosynthesis enzyme MoaA